MKDILGKLKEWGVDNILSLLHDSLYLRIKYKKVMHRTLHLRHPRTFNEKLQWLKLNNRKPEFTMMVDKREVKDFVKEILGDEYVIKSIGVWERPEDIEWGKLPKQFVLKTTHGGGNTGVVVCKDKDKFDRQSAIKQLKDSLKIDLYKRFREWPYKNVHKCIIAEEYMDDGSGELNDYKLLCYNGRCRNLFVCTERSNDVKVDFFDTEWNHLPFTRVHQNSSKIIQKPALLKEMVKIAEKLAKAIDTPLVRIDLYDIKGHVYFGEITFFPGGGMEAFQPEEWDYKLGEMIKLPIDKESK